MTANFSKPCRRSTLAAVSIAASMVIGLAGARGADSTNSPTPSASPNNPAPRLAVELRDGSRVVGTCPDDIWLFHSPLLGDLKVSVSQICSIEFASDSDTARLTATNGDAFNVQFTVAALNVEASFGKTELPVKLVESIKVSARGTGRLHFGLVALWSGEGNANDSVGGHNGVLQGGASYVSGKVGQAFSFNGAEWGQRLPPDRLRLNSTSKGDSRRLIAGCDSTRGSQPLEDLLSGIPRLFLVFAPWKIFPQNC